jgi:hypothetical protein
MTNVISFPVKEKEKTKEFSKDIADRTVAIFMKKLLENLHKNNANINDEEFKDLFAFATETIRCSLYSTVNEKHPFKAPIKVIIDQLKKDIS